MVVDVQPDYDLQVDFLNADDAFLPGEQTNSSVRLTNTGTTDASYEYTLTVLSGPCTAALLTYASSLVVDTSDDLAFSVDVGSLPTSVMSVRFD